MVVGASGAIYALGGLINGNAAQYQGNHFSDTDPDAFMDGYFSWFCAGIILSGSSLASPSGRYIIRRGRRLLLPAERRARKIPVEI